MIVAFYRFMPQAILRAVIAHMELTDPDELENLLSNKPDFVIQSTDKQRLVVIAYTISYPSSPLLNILTPHTPLIHTLLTCSKLNMAHCVASAPYET